MRVLDFEKSALSASRQQVVSHQLGSVEVGVLCKETLLDLIRCVGTSEVFLQIDRLYKINPLFKSNQMT